MGSGGNSSQAIPEEGTFDWYVSDAGMTAQKFKAEDFLTRVYAEALNDLQETDYPTQGIVTRKLINFIRDVIVLVHKNKEIIKSNSFIFQLALRDKRFLHACRAPELASFWHECLVYEDETRFNGNFPACPKDRNIFDHMMGVHLEMRGLKLVNYDLDALSENYGKAVTKEAYKTQVQQAFPYFVQAARFGSISAVYHIIDFYKDMLRFADIPATLTTKLLNYAEILAQTLPTALGSLGYLYMVQTYSCLAECIEKYGITRLGLTPEQVDQWMARYNEAQMLALLKAEKLRFHETSVEIFKGHEESLERHRKRLSADTTSSFGEDTQMWTRLITYYVPFRYFLNGTGYDLRHDAFFLPAFDEKGVVPYQYAKLLSKEGVDTLNAHSKQVNAEAPMLEHIHETLDFDPFADVASEMMLNLDFTQPAKHTRYFQPATSARHTSTSSEHSLTLNFA